jgi:hypothetical protein
VLIRGADEFLVVAKQKGIDTFEAVIAALLARGRRCPGDSAARPRT